MVGRLKNDKLIEELNALDATVAKELLVELLHLCPDVSALADALLSELKAANDIQQMSEPIQQSLLQAFKFYKPRRQPRQRQRHGHGQEQDPSEEVSDLLIHTLSPYVDRLQNLLNRRKDNEALSLCLALILSLYNVKDEPAVKNASPALSDDERLEEFEGAAEWISRLWRCAGDVDRATAKSFLANRNIPDEFIEESVPEWDWLGSDD